MKFEATKCDECGRIQGEVNHWVQIHVIKSPKTETVGVVMGQIGDNVIPASDFSDCKLESRDLCGQGCAMKFVAKLLGWSSVVEAAGDVSTEGR